MLLSAANGSSPTKSNASIRLSSAWTRPSKPEGDAFPPHSDPPSPGDLFFEIGLVIAAALGFAVIVGLAL
jgi:hypothetical protein